MARFKRTLPGPLVLLFVAALSVAAVYHMPTALSQLTYAVERGKAQASQEQLQTATQLSDAFKLVAKSLRPSVVSVSSIKRFESAGRSGQPFGGQQIPEELRRFFGEDADRFFQPPTPPRGFEQRGIGTGVIVSENGYILTNNHVVAGADKVQVTLSDKRSIPAEVVGTDKPTDLAVLKIDADGLVAAQLGDSEALEAGDWVLAIGSPFGLEQTVTAGIVSATGRANVGITDYEDFVQTDAAINPGNSGGPLVNLRGEVIGINTAIASRTGGSMGVGFAIPSNMAKSVLDNLIQYGRVERGYLGAMIQDLNEDLASSFGYKSTEGVLIGDVIDDSPASRAGLRAGDIVTQLNGKPVADANELRNAIAATKAGTEVKLRVFRDGQEEEMSVKVGQLESTGLTAAGGNGASQSDLGVTVRTLTPELAEQLGLEADQKGVVVTEVQPGSAAAAVGIQPGDMLVSLGNVELRDVSDFRKALESQDLKKGVRIQVMRDGVRRFVFVKLEG